MIYNRRMKRISAGLCAAVAAILSVAALPTLCACNKGENNENGYSCSFFAMDTAARLAAANVNKTDFEKLSDRVERFLSAAENSLSVSRSNSYIAGFNSAAAGATVELDEISYEALTLAKEVYAETGGYFNPAVYYCEDVYGFAARPQSAGSMPYDREGDTPTLPDNKYVTAFRELAEHFSEVEIFQLDGAYYATKPDFTVSVEGDDNEYSLALDLGGIAKGWCVDKVNEMLAEAGIEYGFFSFGLSSMGVKAHPKGDGNYNVAVGDPRGNGLYTSFKMKNANLSTSGDNHAYYTVDGTRYCHIISPLTGSPIRTGVASVTVVGGGAGRSDALTTALMAMGKERAAQFINENLADCKVVMLIFEEGAGKVLTNAPDYFAIENGNYVLANTVEDGKIVLN